MQAHPIDVVRNAVDLTKEYGLPRNHQWGGNAGRNRDTATVTRLPTGPGGQYTSDDLEDHLREVSVGRQLRYQQDLRGVYENRSPQINRTTNRQQRTIQFLTPDTVIGDLHRNPHATFAKVGSGRSLVDRNEQYHDPFGTSGSGAWGPAYRPANEWDAYRNPWGPAGWRTMLHNAVVDPGFVAPSSIAALPAAYARLQRPRAQYDDYLPGHESVWL